MRDLNHGLWSVGLLNLQGLVVVSDKIIALSPMNVLAQLMLLAPPCLLRELLALLLNGKIELGLDQEKKPECFQGPLQFQRVPNKVESVLTDQFIACDGGHLRIKCAILIDDLVLWVLRQHLEALRLQEVLIAIEDPVLTEVIKNHL